MNRQSILQTACLVAATAKAARTAGVACIMLLAAACTQDEPADADGHALPEGKYPMTFATAVEGLTVTRANTAEGGTTDGVWRTTDEIAVQVGSDVKQYTPATSGTSTTLQAAAGVEPFYWQRSDEKKTVSAWYCGTGYNPTLLLTSSWEVQKNQNDNDGCQRSDFLYAPATDITFADRENASLTFYHQLSKITVHVIRGEQTPDNITGIDAVMLGNDNFKRNGKFNSSEISGNKHYGTWTDADTPVTGTITAKKAPETATITGKTVLATFHALVIPQTVTNGQPLFALTAAGYGSPFIHKAGQETTWNPGKEYTYEVTIKGTALSATLASETIGWGQDGATGEGSVTLPDVIYNLSTAGEITINDNRRYLIVGSGSKAVTISGGSPTVIFQNVEITGDKGVDVTKASSPVLHFTSRNTLSGGIIATTGNTNITVTGDGAESSYLEIKNDQQGQAGIGGNCGNGNIIVNDIYLNITTDGGAGIGTNYSDKTCGNITVTNARLAITTKNNAACIGTGSRDNSSQSTCGNIIIRNCEIESLKSEPWDDDHPAAIGASSEGKCGNIDIYLQEGQTIEEFLEKITVSTVRPVDKVGRGIAGVNMNSSCGTVTWYNSAGEKIGEGAKK